MAFTIINLDHQPPATPAPPAKGECFSKNKTWRNPSRLERCAKLRGHSDLDGAREACLPCNAVAFGQGCLWHSLAGRCQPVDVEYEATAHPPVTCCQDSTTDPHVTSPSALPQGRVNANGTTGQRGAIETRVSRHTLMTYDSRQLNFGGHLVQLHFDGVKRRGALRRIEKSLASLGNAYVYPHRLQGQPDPAAMEFSDGHVCLAHDLTMGALTQPR